MTLDPDHISDRRRLARRLSFWRVVAVLAVAGALLALYARFDHLPGESYVARYDVTGIILDDRLRDAALDAIAEDDDARALILRIDSPGGTVAGGEALYHSLRRVADKKPVVAVMGEVAASAGYMTAIAADRVLARAATVTGSIGVLMQSADITGLLDKLGIKAESIKSSPLKAQPNPLEPLSPEAREANRATVLDMYDMFVDMVAERRAMPRDKVLALADGRVYTGRQAVANGLADAIGGEREARDWLAQEHGIDRETPIHDVEIDDEDRVWRRMMESIGGKTLFSERLNLDGLVSLWHPEIR
ncbi:MAG: signal peptide peptidase SppA [Hyphomicrobiales bacterium]|nr:signal peptide peptidase SppA [Hyphomicrobiales bacterium]